jgi:hypothetical protein
MVRRIFLVATYVFVASIMPIVCAVVAHAQLDIEREPFNYGEATTNEAVADLQKKLNAAKVQLKFEEEHGYLAAVLKHLDIAPSSQVLVASKTSFQLRKISPQRPRAIYFNDHTYVGWVQGGDVLEVMTIDPVQGAVFYTLSQNSADDRTFLRDRGQCLSCHSSARTHGVPGGLVRSVFVSPSGQPHYGARTFSTNHTSPFAERWGGWYVTGIHGAMRHMGNVLSKDRQNPESIDREAGANVTDLSDHLNIDRYLTPHSDIVALMVLEHQVQTQNALTYASYESRSAIHYDGIMNEALDRSPDYVSDTTTRRIAKAGEQLLESLLFVDEFPLTSPVRGTPAFAHDFQTAGPRDSQGRSLRDLDLETRMFKYPCSYLIYSPAFDALPAMTREYVAQRLHDILTAKTPDKTFAHLSRDDRQAILEILKETKPEVWSSVRTQP